MLPVVGGGEPEHPASPPAGTTWVGDWDARFHDRVYGADPIAVGDIAALLTGVQHRSGSTISSVAVRVDGSLVVGARELPRGSPGAVRQLSQSGCSWRGLSETI